MTLFELASLGGYGLEWGFFNGKYKAQPPQHARQSKDSLARPHRDSDQRDIDR